MGEFVLIGGLFFALRPKFSSIFAALEKNPFFQRAADLRRETPKNTVVS
jgi:hypothetical protein